jgi:hypothetical protein
MPLFQSLQAQASLLLTKAHEELGDLVGIDCLLVDATFSAIWIDYRKGSKTVKVHVELDHNRSIPTKVHLTEGNGAEMPFVSQILTDRPTGVMYRSYPNNLAYGSMPARIKESSHNIQLQPKASSFSMQWPF